MSPNKLRRLALATGAELEIDGRVFNAGRERVHAVPKVEAPAVLPEVAPPPPVAPGITREEVMALLDARDAAWQMLFAELGAKINAIKPAPKKAQAVSFTYDELGRIERAHITPKE
ncbi:MAG: hypothetical protein ING91_19545 [Rhodocyclaceae bacterium]|nr:hypothetical protein [Rhodocyclaceae bacterium]MCA3848764.1 hypothetical protein [Burkholderia sp.]